MRRWIFLGAVLPLLAACSPAGSSERSFTIKGSNMQNTLQPGSHLRLHKAETGYAAAPGDIVEYTAPGDWDSSSPLAISRVIAVGGQTVRGSAGKVEVSTDHGRTYRTLDEPYVLLDGPDPDATFPPVTVPAGRLWLMGDHRNDSIDSRYHCGLRGLPADTTTDCDPMAGTVPVSSVGAYLRK